MNRILLIATPLPLSPKWIFDPRGTPSALQSAPGFLVALPHLSEKASMDFEVCGADDKYANVSGGDSK